MISGLLKIPILKRLIPSLSIKILKLFKKNRGYFKINNLKMFLDFLDPIDRELILHQEYEKSEINYLTKQIDYYKPFYFLDVGANCGYYSIKIANDYPNIKIFAFEPNKEAYFKFNKTLKVNYKLAKKIALFNFGLSNLNTKLKVKSLIKHGYAQTGGSSIDRTYTEGSYKETKEIFKIADEFLNIDNSVIIIKIDVESHELKVLEGLKKMININKCIIQIEICKKNYSKVNNFLIFNKYRLIKAINERSNYFYKNFD